MRRLIIIVLVLIAAWFIFHKDESSKDINKETEETVLSEEQETEELNSDEEENSSKTTKKSPQAVEPTPQDLVEKVEEASLSNPQTTKKVVTSNPVTTKENSLISKQEKEELMRSLPVDEVIRVYLYEWGVDVSRNEIESGNIAFEVVNNGTFSHNFSIRDVKDFGKVLPGQHKVFISQMDGGEFELYSPRDVDMNYGMSEMLVVN